MQSDLFSDDSTLEEEKGGAIVEGRVIVVEGGNDMLVGSNDVFVDIGDMGGIATKIRDHEHGMVQHMAHAIHAVGMMNDDDMVVTSRSLPRRLILQESLHLLLKLRVLTLELRLAGVSVVAQRREKRDEDHIRCLPRIHSESCAWGLPIRHVGRDKIIGEPELRAMLLVKPTRIRRYVR